MRPLFFRLPAWLLLLVILPLSCIDPEVIDQHGTVDVIVVDALLTDQNEPQIVRLNRSQADPITGRFGTLPLTKATVELTIDAGQPVAFHETVPGTYLLPDGVRARPDHRYQLSVTLTNGTRYVSSVETVQPVPAISRVVQRFEPKSIASNSDRLRPANEFFIDTQDPADQINYYRWDWTLWERQPFCHSCYQGYYAVYDQQNRLVNGCVSDFTGTEHNDYRCQTDCWEIIRGTSLNLLADNLINGRSILGRRVAQVPYLDYSSGLVEVRQSSLSQGAYQYFSLIEQQTQRSGGLADTPPATPIGNLTNPANPREAVVGYFTVSAVSRVRYWLDRAAINSGPPIFNSLFDAQYGRPAEVDGRVTIVCQPSNSRTPFKPNGWQD